MIKIIQFEKQPTKTNAAIQHILTTTPDIKTDITDINTTALKDLYIIDDNKKYYAKNGFFDTVLNTLELNFI